MFLAREKSKIKFEKKTRCVRDKRVNRGQRVVRLYPFGGMIRGDVDAIHPAGIRQKGRKCCHFEALNSKP